VYKDDTTTLSAGDRPFAHPHFWAAFTLLGDPECPAHRSPWAGCSNGSDSFAGFSA
jgi:hypothetical protein